MKISTFFTVILFVAATSISCGGNSARTLRAADGGKPKMLWFDAEANFKRFASQDSIRYYLDRTVECGFNHIVVDVRPIWNRSPSSVRTPSAAIGTTCNASSTKRVKGN